MVTVKKAPADTELKPCPFCGNEAKFEQTECSVMGNGSCKLSFCVRCTKCNASAPSAFGYIAVRLGHDGKLNCWHSDIEDAVKAWNMRADND